jgi:hypothetical protein
MVGFALIQMATQNIQYSFAQGAAIGDVPDAALDLHSAVGAILFLQRREECLAKPMTFISAKVSFQRAPSASSAQWEDDVPSAGGVFEVISRAFGRRAEQVGRDAVFDEQLRTFEKGLLGGAPVAPAHGRR